MKTFELADLSNAKRHHLMLSAVGPRPIALVSTIDANGLVNLSPFSFFNLFSTNPPIAIFSVSRRGLDGSLKDTHLNLLEVPEVAINLVNYAMVQQMSLSSNEYPRGVNEFVKAGFTMTNCSKIRPPYVAESPVVLECKVKEVIALGNEYASGNMVICNILSMHVSDSVLDEDGLLDTTRMDVVGRMGGNWYCRANADGLFQVTKPGRLHAIGIDMLPQHILSSELLSANDLGILGSQAKLPTIEDLSEIELLTEYNPAKDSRKSKAEKMLFIHQQIKYRIAIGQPELALTLAFWAEKIWKEK